MHIEHHYHTFHVGFLSLSNRRIMYIKEDAYKEAQKRLSNFFKSPL